MTVRSISVTKTTRNRFFNFRDYIYIREGLQSRIPSFTTMDGDTVVNVLLDIADEYFGDVNFEIKRINKTIPLLNEVNKLSSDVIVPLTNLQNHISKIQRRLKSIEKLIGDK